ncbi:MAG TPA: HAMP domain-containing sensor histidine kinase, partial [Polyangiaceae bacterium]|nr:HAMP domain-containing sensor histidine kinase [Polyangiaceae bacterium]
ADTQSPLPGRSPTAARIGLQPRRLGLEPAKVPEIFAAIAEAIGAIGASYDLSIGADEYRIFQRCIDAGIAASIENFWANEQLLEKKRITERFGYLAHELRSSLGNAALAFKLLRTGCVTVDGRTGDVLAKNLARMESLVMRTLTSVRLDVGAPLELRPLRVASLLRELQASALPERAMSIALEVDESIHVEADEMLLSSAVSNLLHNALKFSCSGAHIAVRCHSDERFVLIEVEDECGGLAEDDDGSLFQPFVKGHGSVKNLGLGLAITRQAMEAMGGSVAVRNVPGHGCVFSLRLHHRAPGVSKARG